MDSIVVGQILSIGYENVNIEHFMVAALGSVIAEENFKNDHDELSPVKLVAASKSVRPRPPQAIEVPAEAERSLEHLMKILILRRNRRRTPTR